MTEPVDTSTPPPAAADLFELRTEPPRYVDPDLPLIPDDSSTRPRRQPARRQPRLDWRPARGIALRSPGGGDDDWKPATAVAFKDGWAIARTDTKNGPNVTAYPAWRVIEIQLRDL
jgi:hypothetical protein